ncbi:hypothetical protein [Gordonia sihwensis]|uniref:hypothetical protein n=1 Tax=Gordonia sihwensis TaxID=173559 RepID=UPI0005ED4FB1|nr:hypothetical protein [Gordonia sihwensis]KJR10242.1 hypothetical protein UG54_01290 [Gordonia sihwensis]
MTASATPTPIFRLDHVDVPAIAEFDERFPVGSDERFAKTREMARNQALRRRAAKLRAEEQKRADARRAAYDADNAAVRVRMKAAVDDYVFGDDFR